MAKCIFCDNELMEDTKPEHILLNTLGGRKTTRRVDCSVCNGTFGSTIDAEVGEQVAVLRNALQLDSGTGRLPPMLRRIQSGNDIINLANDGTPELVAKPFAIRNLEDGRFELQITARSVEEVAPYIPHIAAQLGCPEEQVLEILKSATGSYVERPPDTVHHALCRQICASAVGDARRQRRSQIAALRGRSAFHRGRRRGFQSGPHASGFALLAP
jgi:hypothetical protein